MNEMQSVRVTCAEIRTLCECLNAQCAGDGVWHVVGVRAELWQGATGIWASDGRVYLELVYVSDEPVWIVDDMTILDDLDAALDELVSEMGPYDLRSDPYDLSDLDDADEIWQVRRLDEIARSK